MDLSGISFFDHEDFSFAKDEDENLKQQKAIRENSISLIVLNKKVYRDEKVKGFVKIYVRNELPRGHIEMKCETLLNLSIRKKFQSLDVNNTINEYKKVLKPVKKRKPFFNRLLRGFKSKKFSEKEMKKNRNKIHPGNKIQKAFKATSFLQRLGRGNISKKSRVSIDDNDSIPESSYRGLKSSFKLLQSKQQSGSDLSRKGSSSNQASRVFQPPGNDLEGDMVEKSYLLKSQLMTLFSLRDEIKFKSGLLIPFELTLPKDMPVSFNQCLNLSKVVDIKIIRDHMIKNKKMTKITKSLMEKKSQFMDENKEKISIEHKLIVYFVSHEDKKEEKKDEEINTWELFVNQVNKISSEQKFEVYDRMKNKDFEKYFSKTRISASTNKKRNGCCMIGLMKSKVHYSLNISIDRLKFRNKDSSINFVISYPNVLLKVYDYIDVILVCSTTHKDQDITRKKKKIGRSEKKKKSIVMIFQNSIKNKKSIIENNEGITLKNIIKLEEEDKKFAKHKTRPLTMNSKEFKKKEEKKIERIIYASSLDILGKRKLKTSEEMSEEKDNDINRTELVHRINLSDIITNIQTVISEKIIIEYNLKFYSSIGPLSFTRKINEIPLTFISIPSGKDFTPSEDVSRKFEEAHKKVPKTENGFLLPFARVKMD